MAFREEIVNTAPEYGILIQMACWGFDAFRQQGLLDCSGGLIKLPTPGEILGQRRIILELPDDVLPDASVPTQVGTCIRF